MGHLHFDSHVLILLICLLGGLALLGGLFRPFLQKHGLAFRSRRLAHITEPIIFLLLLHVLIGWPLIAPPGHGRLTEDPLFSILGKQHGLWMAVLVSISLACIMATRLIRSRAGILMACIGATLAGFGCLWWVTMAGQLQSLHGNDSLGMYNWQWFVPSGFMAARIFAWALIVILGAFYAVRPRFSWIRFLSGAIIAGFAAYFALMPFWTWRASWFAVVPFTALAVMLVLLPLQREALERFLGLPLKRGGGDVDALPATPEARYSGHAALLILAGLVAVSAAVNYFEREQVRMFIDGPRLLHHSPAERNASDDLKLVVVPDTDPDHAPLIDRIVYPADFTDYLKLFDQITSETRAQLFAGTGWEAFRLFNDSLREYTDGLEQAAQADYLQFPNSATIPYSRFQNLSKLLGIRSQLAIHEGRTLDGVNDIKTLYRLCGLLNEQPWVFPQAIGFYSRLVANGAAYNALIQFRQDEQGLLALASAMDAVAHNARVSLNLEAVRRAEAGMFMPIVPNADLLIRNDQMFATRTYSNGMLGWLNFDLVRMAVALELYHVQNGSYPDDPQEITPAYLARLPLDPIEGKPYQYRKTESGEYELRCPWVPDSWLSSTNALRPFTFPLSEAGKKREEVKQE